jgi:hypothetical protein
MNQNKPNLIAEVLKKYGDTSDESGHKFGLELTFESSVYMIKTCDLFYHFMDTVRFSGAFNGNKENVVLRIDSLNRLNPDKRDSNFFLIRGIYFFRIRDFNSALVDIDSAIGQGNYQAANFKAFTLELMGNYDQAADLYKSIAELTGERQFLMYEAIVRRKKAGN